MKKTLENLYTALENIEYTVSDKAITAIEAINEQVEVNAVGGEWTITNKEFNLWCNEIAHIITEDINEQVEADIADVRELLDTDTYIVLPDEIADAYLDAEALLDYLGYGYEQADVDDFRPYRF